MVRCNCELFTFKDAQIHVKTLLTENVSLPANILSEIPYTVSPLQKKIMAILFNVILMVMDARFSLLYKSVMITIYSFLDFITRCGPKVSIPTDIKGQLGGDSLRLRWWRNFVPILD